MNAFSERVRLPSLSYAIAQLIGLDPFRAKVPLREHIDLRRASATRSARHRDHPEDPGREAEACRGGLEERAAGKGQKAIFFTQLRVATATARPGCPRQGRMPADHG